MQRRTMIRNLLLAGAGAAFPLHNLLAGVDGKVILPGRPFHRFKLGTLDMTVITDGHIRMAPVQPSFAPEVRGDQVDSVLRSNFRSASEVDLGMNILLIKKEDKLIMIDSGYGSYGGVDSGWLPKSLSDAGFAPGDVTDIVVTHAHPDHIGGLLQADGHLAFLHAIIHMSVPEHRFWSAAQQDFSKSKIKDKALLDAITGITRKTLKGIQERLQLFDYSTALLGCIQPVLAAGHTPGHSLVRIFSGTEEMVHVGDLVHSDVLLFPHPEWGFFGDTNFDQAVATRNKVLAGFVGSKKKVFAGHLSWPGIGHVRAKDQAFEWVPETYAFPD